MDFGIVLVSFVLTLCVARWFRAPGPGFWAVMCALAVATWRLNCAGSSWGDVGLRMPDSLLRTLGWVAVLYVGSVLMKVLVIDPLATAAGWPPLNLSSFSKLPGNAAFLAGALLLVWVQAAFCWPGSNSRSAADSSPPHWPSLDRRCCLVRAIGISACGESSRQV